MENKNLIEIIKSIKNKINIIAEYSRRVKQYNKRLENMLFSIDKYKIESCAEESTHEMETDFFSTCILEESKNASLGNEKELLFNAIVEHVNNSLINRKAFTAIFNRLYMSEPVTISTIIRECGVARYRVMEIFKAIKKYEEESTMEILKREDRGGELFFSI